ncbi:MAG: TetR/AcrR family transcriptional regulator [Myxococcota bacterium]
MTAPEVAAPHLEWIRPPHQERSHRTLERLLDATEALLAERDFDDIGVAEIARAARSSVGAFYTRFPDKIAILHALHERFCTEAFATADATLSRERWRGRGIAELLSTVVPFLVRVVRDRRGLQRAVLVQSLVNRDFRERSARLTRHLNQLLSERLLDRRREIRHPDPALASDFGLRQVLAALDAWIVEPETDAGLRTLSDAQIAAELTRSFLAYLGVRGPSTKET